MDTPRFKKEFSTHSMDFTFSICYPRLVCVISTHRNDIFAHFAGSIQRSKTVKEIERTMRSARVENAKVIRMTLGVTAVVSGVKKKG
jgi:ubiquinone/menaquinone biosynthesis C-methylase UbiE